MTTVAAGAEAEAGPSAEALRHFLDGEHRWIRERVRQVLSRPEFAPVSGITRDEHREVVLEWMRALAEEGGTKLGFPVEYGGEGNVGGSIAAFETLGHGDLSLL